MDRMERMELGGRPNREAMCINQFLRSYETGTPLVICIDDHRWHLGRSLQIQKGRSPESKTISTLSLTSLSLCLLGMKSPHAMSRTLYEFGIRPRTTSLGCECHKAMWVETLQNGPICKNCDM